MVVWTLRDTPSPETTANWGLGDERVFACTPTRTSAILVDVSFFFVCSTLVRPLAVAANFSPLCFVSSRFASTSVRARFFFLRGLEESKFRAPDFCAVLKAVRQTHVRHDSDDDDGDDDNEDAIRALFVDVEASRFGALAPTIDDDDDRRVAHTKDGARWRAAARPSLAVCSRRSQLCSGRALAH